MAKFEEIGAEFCVFKSNAPGLKLHFCGPYVDMPTCRGAGRYFALVRQNERGSGGPPRENFEI